MEKQWFRWGRIRAGLCDVDFYLVILCLGLNVNVLFCATLCAYTFSACYTFALWDVGKVKTVLHTIAWQISRKTHKGERQIKIHWMRAHMVLRSRSNCLWRYCFLPLLRPSPGIDVGTQFPIRALASCLSVYYRSTYHLHKCTACCCLGMDW